MESVKIQNELFTPSNVKCVTVNNFVPNDHQKNFINSVQNACNTLGCLERSIRKSNEYEQKLFHCRSSHSHSHDVNEWWDTEQSEDKSYPKCSQCTTGASQCKTMKSQEDYTDTWSTMSIVCLQYQYEELAKRYKALLQAYDVQCAQVGLRDKRLEDWRERATETQAHLSFAHKTLLAVGEKFLALKEKRNAQKRWYEDQLSRMRQALHDMMAITTRARMKFDARLKYYMENERNSDSALLLYEIRKCNLLFLENMRLKALIEELIPGHVDWKKNKIPS